MNGPWEDFQSTSGPWSDFAPQVSTSEDLKKTALPSLARAAIGTVGLPGDIGAAMSSAGDMLGLSPSTKSTIGNIAGMLPVLSGFAKGPTSPELTALTEKATGPLYQPQTPIGKIADTAAQMAPALFGGPESLGAKLLTRVGAPALGAEAAGALTNDNPYAKTAAAVAASALAHRAITPSPPDLLPTNQQLREVAKTEGYQHPAVQDIRIQPSAFERFVDTQIANLNQRGQLSVPESAGPTHAVLERLRNPGNLPGLPQGVGSIQELRSAQMALSDMSRAVDPQTFRPTSNAVAAGRTARAIGDFMENLPPSEVLAGDPQEAIRRIREANRNWMAQAKSEIINKQEVQAARRAAKSGSGTNQENAMRQLVDQAFGPGKYGRPGLTPQQLTAADRIVEGSFARDSLRKFGKLGFGDGLSLLLHAGAALPSGGLSIPLGIAGTVARKVGEGMTRRDIQALERSFRANSPEAAAMQQAQTRLGGAAAPAALPGGLLAALMAARQQPAGLLSSLVLP